MLPTTAIFGELAPNSVDAVRLLLFVGGDDIGTRVDIFEEIFLVFMGLGTLVGIVVIAYTLYNAYVYRDGNDATDDPKGRPQLGELPTGAEKGGRKLFLSFAISAVVVVSLIAWTYGMLLVVEGQSPEVGEDDIEVQVNGWAFGWDYVYEDDETVPVDTAENLALAAEDDGMDIDSGDLDAAAETGDIESLLATARAEAEDSHEFSPGDFDRDVERVSSGMSDDGAFRGESFLLPANQRVYLTVTAEDVWHNFGIPELRVKSDAIPGEATETWFETEEPTDGDPYVAECFELCGTGHSNMKSQVEVVPQEEFQAWYDSETVAVEALDEFHESNGEEDETAGQIDAPTTAGVIGK